MANSNSNSSGIPKIDLIRSHPETAAMISKAVRPVERSSFDVNDKKTYYSLNSSKINSISDSMKERLTENENILSIFPDILLAEQIIVSSILSPKDMISENLIYKTMDTILPSNIQIKINNIIKTHMESYYNLIDELPIIIRDSLFRSGSYISAVIPEAAIDEIINGQSYSAESDGKYINDIIDSKGQAISLGILGPSKVTNSKTSLESFFNSDIPVKVDNEPYITIETSNNPSNKKEITTKGILEITDNYQILKLPKLLQSISAQRIKRAIRNPLYTSRRHFSLENINNKNLPDPKKISYKEFSDLVFKGQKKEYENFVMIPNRSKQKRYSIGRPLRTRIPSEAVIPVFPPGNPSSHRGYFVLTDTDGNWVTRTNTRESTSGLEALVSRNGQSNSLMSLILDKANRTIGENTSSINLDNMSEIYGSIIESDMINRLKNGIYGTDMVIGRDKEWDRVMLARALAGKMTRLVYIPNEIITYYAYMFHDNGIGKSYLDHIKILTSMRAVLLFSKVMAQVKNSINVTKADITLDPNDPDPEKTIEIAVHEIIKLRESYFPLGVNSPVDLMQWVQRAGVNFTFKGHPGLPETSFEFSNGNMSHNVPDEQISEDLRKQTFMTFGLTPEQVDEGFSANFATTILHQNALFAKRISLLSNQTSILLTNDIKNICINDAVIIKEIGEVLKEAGDDITKYLDEKEKNLYNEGPDKFRFDFIERVIDNIWVDLPKPDLGVIEDKLKAFDNMSEALDKVLPSFISSEVINSEIHGEMATHADEIQKFWKHYLLRKWVTEEGFIPEISELFERDENDNPSNDILDIMEKYNNEIMLSAAKYIEKVKAVREAANKDLENLKIDEGTINSSSSYDTSEEDTGENQDSDLETDITEMDTSEEPADNEEEVANKEEGQGKEETDKEPNE